MADNPKPDPGPGQADKQANKKAALAVYWRMLTCLFIATCVILVLFLLLAAIDFWRPSTGPARATWFLRIESLLAVAGAGAFGAIFSSLLRVYKFSDLPSEITGSLTLRDRDLILYTLTPMLVGAISALVLYGIFAGQLLTGDLFPNLPRLYPDNAMNAAKALFWAFVAGFAERLVPGFLESFADTAGKRQPKDETPPKPAPAESSRAQAHDE